MKRIYIYILLLQTFIFSGQQNQSWRSFFSYNNIVDLAESNNRIHAASENAMFSKSLITNELKTITSVDGLKAETITTIHYSTEYKKTLVGNSNGLLLVLNSDGTVLNVIDIIEETTIPSNRKKINHIYEYEGKAYVSCDFGIAVFNLATLEFGDTYYIGASGEQIAVQQVTVLNNNIYAATSSGLRTANLNNPNIINFMQWSDFDSRNWAAIATYNNNLVGATTDGFIHYYNSGMGVFLQFSHAGGFIFDFRIAEDYLVVTSNLAITVFSQNFMQAFRITQIPNYTVNFTCATIIDETFFVGTNESGLFSAPLNNPNALQNTSPSGPLKNNIFSLEKSTNDLWVVYGGYNYSYTPDYSSYGLSKLTSEGWFHIPYEDVFEAKSLSDIVVNPNNQNQVYVSSYHSGLLRIENDIPITLYNKDNTNQNGQDGLQSVTDPSSPAFVSVRINSMAYDKNNNLWMTNAMVSKPLKVLKPNGQFVSYSFEDATQNLLTDAYGKMAIDKNGTKWIPSRINGVIAFNEEQGNKFIIISGENSNMPSIYAKSVAIDNRNQLWIGTDRGLRVLSGIDRFLTEMSLTTSPIIIMEDGIAQELMYEQVINEIVVDGANNKWLATTSGAFLVSPDGQRTIYHFTKENSPLPSNTINDIEIDAVTGDIYFATDKGMVVYQGTSTQASDNLNNVYVFPNPVRPGFEGDVNISGLINKANIKITDIEGNLVYETTSEGGTVLWDTRAFGKYKVASGVYMIFIASEDGTKTKVKKVMIVR